MADIEIRASELNSPKIDEVISIERSLAKREGDFVENIKTPFYLNPVFYYSVAATIGSFLVWTVVERFFAESVDGGEMIALLSNYLMFAPMAGIVGFAVGLTYGIANRNWRQALYAGAVGLGVGFGVTLLTSLLAGWLYGLSTYLALLMEFKGELPSPGEAERFTTLHGLAFVIQMCGRGIAWAIICMGAGIGLGIATKSKKLMLNGFVGGMVGGMLGGLFFDPVHRFIMNSASDAWLSRAVGFSAVGLLVGLFIGFFENLSKDSWFLMIRGPLAGKQFILFKSPMTIGSAPKCDIYLFKDPAIEPRHALVTLVGSKYILADQNTPAGISLNGNRTDKCVLQQGDLVAIGDTVLKYNERQKTDHG